MFLHLSVSHSVRVWGGGVSMMSLPVWLPDPMFFRGGLCAWSHVYGLPIVDPLLWWTSEPYVSYWNAVLLPFGTAYSVSSTSAPTAVSLSSGRDIILGFA